MISIGSDIYLYGMNLCAPLGRYKAKTFINIIFDPFFPVTFTIEVIKLFLGNIMGYRLLLERIKIGITLAFLLLLFRNRRKDVI